MRKSDKKGWYALYTTPRAEKKVAERLKGEGVECFLPLHKSRRKWADRVKVVELPLFSSYVFVRCNQAELYPLKLIPGVVTVVKNGENYTMVRESEIKAIREFLEKAENHRIVEGDEVMVVLGSFKNVSGKVKMVGKHHIVLTIDSIGVTVCAQLDAVVKRTESIGV
ncbi:UpxY family transcription antiterminator [Porphyromonadaceae bacterium]